MRMFTSHHMSRVTCHLSCVMCHCQMSPVTCHVSLFFLSFWSQLMEGLLSSGPTLSSCRSAGAGGEVAFNSEHLPLFWPIRLGLHTRADSVHAKKSHGKGADIYIDRQTDIATTRPNRPSGPIRWKFLNLSTKLEWVLTKWVLSWLQFLSILNKSKQ